MQGGLFESVKKAFDPQFASPEMSGSCCPVGF